MWLKLLLPVLRLAAGAGQAKRALARLAVVLTLLFIALVLALAALGFALGAVYGYLATLMTPPAAAAITAAATLALAAIVVAAALYRPRRGRAAPGAIPGIEAQLARIAGRLTGWARQNPWEAAGAAFIVGFAMSRRR